MLKTILLIIIVCEILGITGVRKEKLLGSMIYYTQLSNVAAMLSAFFLLMFGPLTWVTSFRFLGVCMLVMTCLVTIFVLQPLLKNSRLLFWCRTGFFLHLVCPFLNTVSYVFLEEHAGRTAILIPAAATLLYGGTMLYLNYIDLVDGPYPFLRLKHQSKTATIIWVLVMLAAISLISAAVSAAAR